MSPTMNQPGDGIRLEYPMTVAVFDTYGEAQKAVDTLADAHFDVRQLAIVGTDLRQYERVLGRKTWGSVLLGGAVSGLTTGLMVGLLLVFLGVTTSLANALMLGLAFGAIAGAIGSALAHALSRGERDFTSITQTFATRYEVMAEHKVAGQARQLLGGMVPPSV